MSASGVARSRTGRARNEAKMKLILLATAASSAAALSLRVQPKMSVAVFGATGLTGRECTHQLLERGVPVRALCRDPAKLLTPLGSTGKEDLVENDKLYKYKGSVTDAAVRAQRPVEGRSASQSEPGREMVVHGG